VVQVLKVLLVWLMSAQCGRSHHPLYLERLLRLATNSRQVSHPQQMLRAPLAAACPAPALLGRLKWRSRCTFTPPCRVGRWQHCLVAIQA
jgi:hypothetical protein